MAAGRLVTELRARAARCGEPLRAVLPAKALAAAVTLGLLASPPSHAANEPTAAPHGMQSLQDDELADVRGADGIAFNLDNFSIVSSLTNPLSLTYLSPNGSSLTLSGLSLLRTDDPDPFADPYQLTLQSRPGLQDMIALDFPLNAAGNQQWSLTADFSQCDMVTAGACTGTNFVGGTLQVQGLTMKGGGLYISPTPLADTQGVAFGLGTQLDIASLSVYSRGRASDGTIDTSDALAITGIHLANVAGGPWMLADLDQHPGLFNADTDATGSYLHFQVGWPTAGYDVPAASLKIDNITFTTAGVNGAAASVTNLGSASIASMQINYVDIKFRTSP
jgi:hypothetical protein